MDQYLSEYISHPLAPVLTLTLVVLVLLLSQRWFAGLDPSALQKKLGADGIGVGWFWFLSTFWAMIFLLLFGGLLWTIYQILIGLIPNEGENAKIWSWRFSVLKLASLTAVLGAVVALPFTMVRLHLSRQQVATALEALTNDKMDNAVADLHAQRQITHWKDDGTAENGWEDDIMRRNGAIDRLLGLVEENKTLRMRVERLLTVYLRELTREYPATEVPADATSDKLMDWAAGLVSARSDMENAVQALSRLPRPVWKEGGERLPDLQKLNMQAFFLSDLILKGAEFKWAQLQGAYLANTQLQGANFRWARLQGAYFVEAKLEGADLSNANLQGADLFGIQVDERTNFSSATLDWAGIKMVDLSNAPQIAKYLEKMFGDRTVVLPHGVDYPAHWPDTKLRWDEFDTQWRAWQRAGGFDSDNPK